MIPSRRCSIACSSGLASHMLVPASSILPAAGRCSPTMWRISVLFPEPLPPMMMKMSPSPIVNVRCSIRMRLPKAMVRSTTSICGGRCPASATTALDAKDMGDHVDQEVGDDHHHDPADHGRCSRGTHRGGIPARANTAQATRQPDQQPEYRRLADADCHVLQTDELEALLVVGDRRDA